MFVHESYEVPSLRLYKYVFFVLLWLIILFVGCATSKNQYQEPTSAAVPEEELPILRTTLPFYIRGIFPKPGANIPTKVYESEESFPDSFSLGFLVMEARPGSHICIAMDYRELALPGDTDNDIETKTKLQLNIDGVPVKVAFGEDILDDGMIIYHDGKTAKINSPILMCYYAELEIGVHDMVLQYTQTSGNILKYHWEYILTR